MSKRIVTTLSYIKNNGQLVLALKKRGFGVGKWNGYGGKIIDGETLEESAIREIKEEAEIEVSEIEKRGVIHFSWQNENNRPIKAHVYEIIKYRGEPKETEEMKPVWYEIDNLPYHEMWADDRYWLPTFLEGKYFKAKFVFDDNDQVIDHSIEEIKKAFTE